MPVAESDVRGGLAALSSVVRARAESKEELGHLDVPTAGRRVHRREVRLLAGVGVGAALEEHARDLVILHGSGGVHRRDALRVLRGGVHVGALGDQVARQFGVAEEDRYRLEVWLTCGVDA